MLTRPSSSSCLLQDLPRSQRANGSTPSSTSLKEGTSSGYSSTCQVPPSPRLFLFVSSQDRLPKGRRCRRLGYRGDSSHLGRGGRRQEGQNPSRTSSKEEDQSSDRGCWRDRYSGGSRERVGRKLDYVWEVQDSRVDQEGDFFFGPPSLCARFRRGDVVERVRSRPNKLLTSPRSFFLLRLFFLPLRPSLCTSTESLNISFRTTT